MTTSRHTTKTGEAAVDGLLAGMVAGLAMALYLVLSGLLGGTGISESLAMFTPFGEPSPMMGLLSHLAVSAIYGALFGVLTAPLGGRLPGWLSGLVFGLLLIFVARLALLPETSSALAAVPAIHFSAAHLIYGLVLGLLIGRKGG